MSLVIVCVVLGLATICALVALFALKRRTAALKRRFSAVVDADAESARIHEAARQKIVAAEDQAARLLAEAHRSLAQIRDEAATEIRRREALGAEYAKAKSTFDQLGEQVRHLEENLEDISFGFYKPHYNFDTPEEFKRELEKIRDDHKSMVREQTAATFART